MSKRDWWLVGGVGVALFAATFGYVVWTAPPAPGAPPGARDPVDPTTVSTDAELVVRYLMGDGTVAETSVGPVSAELVGLRLHEVQELRPEWLVRSFSAARLVVDAPCRIAPEAGGFLAPYQGKVAIFSGRPDGCRELRELTGIPVEGLPAAVRSALEAGIPFESDSDLPQLLEGIQGAV